MNFCLSVEGEGMTDFFTSNIVKFTILKKIKLKLLPGSVAMVSSDLNSSAAGKFKLNIVIYGFIKIIWLRFLKI